MNTLVAPLAVWPGLNEVIPHEAAGVQFQVTPPFIESLATVATRLPVVPTTIVVGAVVILTLSVGGGLCDAGVLLQAASPSAQSRMRTIQRIPRFMAFLPLLRLHGASDFVRRCLEQPTGAEQNIARVESPGGWSMQSLA